MSSRNRPRPTAREVRAARRAYEKARAALLRRIRRIFRTADVAGLQRLGEDLGKPEPCPALVRTRRRWLRLKGDL